MIPYGSEVGFPFHRLIFNLSRLSGVVFNALRAAKSSGFRSKMSGFASGPYATILLGNSLGHVVY